MWNTPTQAELNKIPRLYETENIPLASKIIHMHFFLANCDWYIAEHDPEEQLFFGYANLGDDMNSEWGYISFQELKDLIIAPGIHVDHDLYWKPRPAREVEKIVNI